MLALRYSQDTGLKVQEVPKPQPKHGWAVIRVLIAGGECAAVHRCTDTVLTAGWCAVCSTDQEIVKGLLAAHCSYSLQSAQAP